MRSEDNLVDWPSVVLFVRLYDYCTGPQLGDTSAHWMLIDIVLASVEGRAQILPVYGVPSGDIN